MLWHMQDDTVDKEGVRRDPGADVATVDGRAVRARITRSDGTKVIGHMEVMFVPDMCNCLTQHHTV